MAEVNELYLLDLPLGDDLVKKRVLVQLVERGDQAMRFITCDSADVQEDLHVYGSEIPEHYNASALGRTEEYLAARQDHFEAALLLPEAVGHGMLTMARTVRGMEYTNCDAAAALRAALAEGSACVKMAERQRAAADAVLSGR